MLGLRGSINLYWGNTRADGNSSVAIGGDDLDQAGSKRYVGADKFIDYNDAGVKTGEYDLNNKALRDIYNRMTGDTMNATSYRVQYLVRRLLHSVFNLKRQLIYLLHWGLNLKLQHLVQ